MFLAPVVATVETGPVGEVRAATEADRDDLAAVLADAFVDDPVMAWAFPDPASRPRLLQAMFRYLAEHLYLPAGACTTAGEAGALWLPVGVEGGDAFWEAHGEGFAIAVEGHLDRLASLGAAMAEHHPSGPHRYLLAIGVRPGAQGRGLGGALLDHTLRLADAAGEPAYLEASSIRSRVLYERHGFEVTGELSADGSPPMWPMWRGPR